uniref:Uncharacterized protein n=1 Tax=Roseihalotalea indica TaxID=2867963 RepID=A0AA49JJ64_9BACT|nr:hypothetical protein K4G66_08200 [Tunicatimonas sp. TK19036]
MPYALTIIQQVVRGPLSPLSFPENALKLPRWYQLLTSLPTTCTKQIHVQFAQTHPEISIDSSQIRLVDSSQLPSFLAFQHQVQPVDNVSGEVLLTGVLHHYSLATEAVKEWYHWQDEQGQGHLELYAAYALDTLSFEEMRYVYFQQLLQEQVASVEHLMVETVHDTQSAKKAEKYVQDHQQVLISLSDQVLIHLAEESHQLYTISEQYSLVDVYKLIFRSLEALMVMLEQQFAQYLDASAPLPYRHRVVQTFQLNERLEALQAVLDGSPMNQDLLTVLEGLFTEIQQLAQKPTTYEQLRYYQRLVQELEAFTQQKTVTDESLLSVLLHMNFNSPAMRQWLVKHLQNQLDTQENRQQPLSLLYYYEKWYHQQPVPQGLAYDPMGPALQQHILSWIKEEIRYREKRADVPFPATESSVSQDKVKTNLSVAQIALLLRLCSEVGIFPEQNLSNLCRRFSSILHSLKEEDISAESLRGKYYEHDRRSVQVLKEKVIAMLNYLNQLPK